MLVVATTVFLYYTTWTLLMVRPVKESNSHLRLLLYNPLPRLQERLLMPLPLAIRRPRPSPPRLLSAPRLGYSHTSHPHPSRFGGSWELFECDHDTE